MRSHVTRQGQGNATDARSAVFTSPVSLFTVPLVVEEATGSFQRLIGRGTRAEPNNNSRPSICRWLPALRSATTVRHHPSSWHKLSKVRLEHCRSGVRLRRVVVPTPALSLKQQRHGGLLHDALMPSSVPCAIGVHHLDAAVFPVAEQSVASKRPGPRAFFCGARDGRSRSLSLSSSPQVPWSKRWWLF